MVKVGDHIELMKTTSIHLDKGDKGTVEKIELSGTQQYILWVKWEEKDTVIPLIDGEDQIKVISEEKVN